MTIRATLLFVLFLLSLTARADDPLPPWFPAGVFSTNGEAKYEEYGGSKNFRTGDPKGWGDTFEARGHHWKTRMWPAAPKPWKPEDWQPAQIFDALLDKLKAQGFTVDYLRTSPDRKDDLLSMRKTSGASPIYVFVKMRPDDHDTLVDIVEVAPPNVTVTLKPPAEQPEPFGDHDDFPYLTPLPGSTLADSKPDTRPFSVLIDHDKGPRDEIVVASSRQTRTYKLPPHLSPIAFEDAYIDALTKAGWEVVHKAGDVDSSTTTVTAHYAGNRRDIWANLQDLGNKWTAEVADVGQQLQAQAKQCTVQVYGVNFDFDKATLRADSEPVLEQVLALFQQDPNLTAEIGGHTDNVGKPDYNLKLSGERAESVRAWLVAHGVAANRLTAHGYGDTMPLVKNDSDENRARNRRVELKKQDCHG